MCVFVVHQDAGSQQIGFLLGSCGVTVALTSDACHKGLPKSATGEIPQFKGQPESHRSAERGKGGASEGHGLAVNYLTQVRSPLPGWPKLLWFVTESKHLSKPPRDWFPHIKDANNDTAYIEVSPVSLATRPSPG